MTTMAYGPHANARDRQLDSIRQRRRRQSWQRRVEQPQEPPFVRYMQFVKEVQRISMAGIMPSQKLFDLCRYTHFKSAAELCATYGVTWDTVAEDAGLKRGRG